MLLDGLNHVALISNDVARLGAFYAEVFDADVGETRPHGQGGGETMTVIRIGPHTELNVFVIDGNTEADRQTPMWGRGRIDHLGLQAVSSGGVRHHPATAHQGRSRRWRRERLRLRPEHLLPRPDGLEGEVLAPKDDA